MPFGKHKGTRLRDLPADYVHWLTENIDPGGWIVQALTDR